MENYNQVNDQSVNWGTNESLLQSYRSIFIASQSLFISAVALTSNSWINILIIVIAIFQLWIGYTVVRARALVVDFYKYNLSSSKNISEFDYVNKRKIRKEANKKIPGKTNWRLTRKKIDAWIPISFLLIWIGFIVHFILLHFYPDCCQCCC